MQKMRRDAMRCDVMWCDAMWRDVDVMWCDVMWCDVMGCAVMWCDVVWCDTMWWMCDVRCEMWDVRREMCGVWCVMCDVWRATRDARWVIMCDVSCLMGDVRCALCAVCCALRAVCCGVTWNRVMWKDRKMWKRSKDAIRSGKNWKDIWYILTRDIWYMRNEKGKKRYEKSSMWYEIRLWDTTMRYRIQTYIYVLVPGPPRPPQWYGPPQAPLRPVPSFHRKRGAIALHTLYTLCIHYKSNLYICTQPMHNLYTIFTHTIYILYTFSIYTFHTRCIHPIHTVCTEYIVHVLIHNT